MEVAKWTVEKRLAFERGLLQGYCQTEFWSFIPAESAVNEGKERVQKVYKIVLAM